MDREVAGVRLVFENGHVVEESAKKNGDFLTTMLNTPGARIAGEIAIGTNHGINQVTKSILFDEKMGGTAHLALGNSLPGTGGKNKCSLHWDMICDLHNGEIIADGEVIYRNGKFLI